MKMQNLESLIKMEQEEFDKYSAHWQKEMKAFGARNDILSALSKISEAKRARARLQADNEAQATLGATRARQREILNKLSAIQSAPTTAVASQLASECRRMLSEDWA